VLIAAFRCNVPARGGAFADEQRVGATKTAAECVIDTRARSPLASFAASVPVWDASGRQRGSRFPPFDPFREAGARTDNAVFTPSGSPPPSVASRPRVAARSPMSGAIVAGDAGGRVRHRRACASVVASFATGVPTASGRPNLVAPFSH
jgi:hypothetical protein